MLRIQRTVPSRVGRAAITAPANTSVTIFGGLLGSALKVWRISGSLPYLSGLSGAANGAFGSSLTFKSKTWLLYGFEEPKDAMTSMA